MSKMKDLYTLLEDPVKSASRRASNNWYGLLEPDDIEQKLWVEILESDTTTEILEASDDNLVVDLLARMADRICIGERDDYEHFTGNYRYSVNEAKVLVEEYFLRNGEELMVELIDVDVALPRLQAEDEEYELAHLDRDPRDYYDAILKRYMVGVYPSAPADKMRQSRALTRLTDHMNRSFKERERDYRDGPGTKPRIPNGYDPYEG